MGELLAIMDHTSMNTGINRDKPNSNESPTILLRQRPELAYEKYLELVSCIILRVATEQERDQVGRFEAAQPEICPRCGGLVRRQSPPFRIVHDVTNCRRRPA